MKNNIVLIQSHCNTEEKKKVLIDNISKLKSYNLDILLYTHIPLEKEITQLVDFYIYDSTNPLLYEERRHYYWIKYDDYMLETTVPDYGWTVYNQIIHSYHHIKNRGYRNVILFCYDVIIDDNVEQHLRNPKPKFFSHVKNMEGYTTHLGFAMILSIIELENFGNVVNSISKYEYAENIELTVEAYMEKKLKDLNLYEQPQELVSDYFHESNNVFNQSESNHFEFFLDTIEYLKFIYKKKSDKRHFIIINSSIIEIETETYFYDEKLDYLDVFGCLVDNEYFDLKKLFLSKRVNEITFYKS